MVVLQVTRSRVERRLQKLEAELTDDSRAVPHTYRWLLYWTEQIGKYMSGEREPVAPFIPLEAFRAVMKVGGIARFELEDLEAQKARAKRHDY